MRSCGGLMSTWSTLDTGRLFPETHRGLGRDRAPLRPAHPGSFPRRRSVEALSRSTASTAFARRSRRGTLLRVAQGRAARPCARRRSRLDHRLRAEQSGERAQRVCGVRARAPASSSSIRCSIGRASRSSLSCATTTSLQCAARSRLPSIGCAPCTRAVAPGEPERAGRWWWEQEEKKECGLHRVTARHRADSPHA